MAAKQSTTWVIYKISFFISMNCLTDLINLKSFVCRIRCIPSKSVVTVKIELLPLTAGIITLDSLQIDVKEKGNDQ
jgi:hypothetical protein